MSRIVIVGGHGKVALLAAPLLVADGHQVRSLVRNPDHADDVAATGAEPVVADVEQLDVDQLAHLFVDTDVVVWSAGAGGGNPQRTRAVDQDAAIRSMDAAEQAGVAHYVMVSYFGAGPRHGVDPSSDFFAYAEAKAAADEHLKTSTLSWTILKPSALTLDDPAGRIDVDALQAGQVARADVAAVIAETVRQRESLAGREVSFNQGTTPIADALTATR